MPFPDTTAPPRLYPLHAKQSCKALHPDSAESASAPFHRSAAATFPASALRPPIAPKQADCVSEVPLPQIPYQACRFSEFHSCATPAGGCAPKYPRPFQICFPQRRNPQAPRRPCPEPPPQESEWSDIGNHPSCSMQKNPFRRS